MITFLKKYTLLFATVFILTIGLAGTAFAYEVAINRDVWAFHYLLKMFSLSFFFIMILSALLALFKKISWFWLFSFLSCSFFFFLIYFLIENGLLAITDNGFVLDSEEIYQLIIYLSIILTPILTPLIQYRRKKIDKKLLKHRFFILFTAFLSLIILQLIIYLMIYIVHFI